MRSLSETFADLRARGRLGFFPFIPAGYPDLDATRLLLPELQRAGAGAIEIGIPFSDPVADGPVIQEAFTHALARKLRVADVLGAVAAVRGSVSIPLIAMVSYSIVFRYGVERFAADARQAGFDAMIIPDLPPPEARPVCRYIRAAGLDTVLLVSPTTPPDRRLDIARLCSGFIYYLSVTGITGERDRLPADLEANVRQVREMAQVPVCVGFGVSKRAHLAQLAPFADAAIVGSALVKQIRQHLAEGPAAMLHAVRGFCRDLLE